MKDQHGAHPADPARRSSDGMPHDMGGHEGNPMMSEKEAMHAESNATHAPAQTHNRHGGNVEMVIGQASGRPVKNR